MSVYYKFKSALTYDSVQFNELSISLEEFKKLVIEKKQFGKNTNFDLSVTNAETNEVYTDDQTLIPKNSSLIVVRVPLTQQRNKNNNWNISENSLHKNVTFGDEDIESEKAFLKVSDLSNCNATEQDKIQAMMYQSTIEYDPAKYVRLRGSNQHGEPPAGYICHKCRHTGHWIQDCPVASGEIKKSSGIPQDFMTPVDGPQVPGALMTPDGSFAVRTIDVEAQKTKGSASSSGQLDTAEKPTIPEDLLCSLCQDLLTEAIMMPCCGDSFCDECIRNALLESEDNQCPECKEKDVSPETLIPNRFLRNSVNSFQNETGYYGQRIKHATTGDTGNNETQLQLSNTEQLQVSNLTGSELEDNSILSEQQKKQIKIENSVYNTKNDDQSIDIDRKMRNFQRGPILQDPLIMIPSITDRKMAEKDNTQQGRVNMIHSINELSKVTHARPSDQHVPFPTSASDFNRTITPIVYGPPPSAGIVHNFSVPPPLRQNIPTHHTVSVPMPVFQQLSAPRQIQPIYSIPPVSVDGRNFRLRGRPPGPVIIQQHRFNAAPITEKRVIDDPLEAFQRHLREKDRRDQLRRARRRSRSLSRGRSHSRIRSKRRSRSSSVLRVRKKSRSPVNITRSKSGTPNASRSRSRSRSRSIAEYIRRSKSRSPLQSTSVNNSSSNNGSSKSKRKRTHSKSPITCSPKNHRSRSKSYNSRSPVGVGGSRRSHSRSRSPRDYHSPTSNYHHHHPRSSNRSSYHYSRRDNSADNNYDDEYSSSSRRSRSSRYHQNHHNHHHHHHNSHYHRPNNTNNTSNVKYRSPPPNRYQETSIAHSNYQHSHNNRYKYGSNSYRARHGAEQGGRSDTQGYQENINHYEPSSSIDSGGKYTSTTTYEPREHETAYSYDNNEWEASADSSYSYEVKKSAEYLDYGYSSPQGQDRTSSYYKGSNKSPNKDSHRRHREADDKKHKTYDELHDDQNIGYNKNRVLVDLKRESSPEPDEKSKKDKKHEDSKENRKEKSKRKKKRDKDSDIEKKKRKKDKEEVEKKEHSDKCDVENTIEQSEDTKNVEETSLSEKCNPCIKDDKDILVNEKETKLEEGNENKKETAKKEEKDVLAVIPPELSKWERDDGNTNSDEIVVANDGNTREVDKTTVTIEILKRAENALFLKSVKSALTGGKTDMAVEEESNNTAREAKRSGNSIQITVGAASRSPDDKPVTGAIYSDQAGSNISHRLSAKERLGAKIQVSDQTQPIVKSTVVAKNKPSPSRTLKSIVGVRRVYSDKNSSSSTYSRHRRSEERYGSNRENTHSGEHGRLNVADRDILIKDGKRVSRWERSRSREKRYDTTRDRRNDTKREKRHNSEEKQSNKKEKSKHSSDHSKHKDNDIKERTTDEKDSKKQCTTDEIKSKGNDRKQTTSKESEQTNEGIKKLPLDEANFEPDYDMASGIDEVDEGAHKSISEKIAKKPAKGNDASESSDSQSASDSSSDTSTERRKKKRKKDKERKRKHRHIKKKKEKSDSSEGSLDESGSDDSKHKHRRKHKHKKKSKKKKRGKQIK